jgi:hypothetical protein
MAFKVPRYASLPYLLAVPAGGLLLAYLYAWLHRPDYPEQYAIEDRKSTSMKYAHPQRRLMSFQLGSIVRRHLMTSNI